MTLIMAEARQLDWRDHRHYRHVGVEARTAAKQAHSLSRKSGNTKNNYTRMNNAKKKKSNSLR